MHKQNDDAYAPPPKKARIEQADSYKSANKEENKTKKDDKHRNNSDDESWRASNRQKFSSGKHYVILGTASIRMQIGTYISPNFRALLDTGAQAGLITVSAVKANKLPLKHCARSINGIGGKTTMKKKLQAYILPWFESDYRLFTELFVSSEFGGDQPWVSLSSIKPGTEKLTLADSNFYQPAPVDILLAADVWSEIVGSILYRHIDGPVMHGTMLGYVVLGKVWLPMEAFECSIYKATILPEQMQAIECESMFEQAIDKSLKQFFSIEDIPEVETRKTKGDIEVEKMYMETFYRKQDGSYVVKIPFKPGKTLGDSRKIVMRRFFSLEKKLQANQALKQKYIEFMREFIELGHMRKAPPIRPDVVTNYIPHHALDAKKFRSVFDASCKTSNGQSLNSIQLVGPKLQLDIQYHLMRFRRFKYAVVTDVIKMFR